MHCLQGTSQIMASLNYTPSLLGFDVNAMLMVAKVMVFMPDKLYSRSRAEFETMKSLCRSSPGIEQETPEMSSDLYSVVHDSFLCIGKQGIRNASGFVPETQAGGERHQFLTSH